MENWLDLPTSYDSNEAHLELVKHPLPLVYLLVLVIDKDRSVVNLNAIIDIQDFLPNASFYV